MPPPRQAPTLAVERLRGLGLACPTALREGLSRTIRWFAANDAGATDGLRP